MSLPGRPKGEYRSAQHESTPVTASLAVLVSERIDPVSGRATRNRNDALAAALALGLAGPTAVQLMHAGEMAESVARDYLALGAPSIELLATATSDTPQDIVSPLAAALASTPLILTGTRANDSFGSGVLPFALAAALGRPVIADVIAIQAEGPHWIVTQALPKGARRRLKLSGPAVLAVSASTVLPLRHSYADRMAGKISRRRVEAASLPPSPAREARGMHEQRVPAARRLKPLEAKLAQSGHARMQAAVGTPASAGGITLTTGSPEDKARAVLQYLREHALVTF